MRSPGKPTYFSMTEFAAWSAAFAVIAVLIFFPLARSLHTSYHETIRHVETVKFNIMHHLFPSRISVLMTGGREDEILKALNSNYGLFPIVITDKEGKRILFASEAARKVGPEKVLLTSEPYDDIPLDPYRTVVQNVYKHAYAAKPDRQSRYADEEKMIGRLYYARSSVPDLRTCLGKLAGSVKAKLKDPTWEIGGESRNILYALLGVIAVWFFAVTALFFFLRTKAMAIELVSVRLEEIQAHRQVLLGELEQNKKDKEALEVLLHKKEQDAVRLEKDRAELSELLKEKQRDAARLEKEEEYRRNQREVEELRKKQKEFEQAQQKTQARLAEAGKIEEGLIEKEGERFEKEVHAQLRKLESTMGFQCLYHSYRVKWEIDHIFVTNKKAAVFVIEDKFYKGKISGDVNDDYWECAAHGDPFRFDSPYKQLTRNIYQVKDKFKESGFSEKDMPGVYGIIVFPDEANIKGLDIGGFPFVKACIKSNIGYEVQRILSDSRTKIQELRKVIKVIGKTREL